MKLHCTNKQATHLRGITKIFIPITIVSLLSSYLYSSIVCYLHQIAYFPHILNQFFTKKALFLLSNIIILFLTYNGLNIDKSTYDREKLHECLDDTEQDQVKSLHHELESNDEVTKCEDWNFIKHKYVLDPFEYILVEGDDQHSAQDVYLDSNDDVHELEIVNEKGVIEESVKYVQSCPNCTELTNVYKLENEMVNGKMKEKRKTCMELVILEVEKSMEVMVMDNELEVDQKSTEVMVIKNELDCLELDELNRRFDEFIEMEKKKRQLENLQIVLY